MKREENKLCRSLEAQEKMCYSREAQIKSFPLKARRRKLAEFAQVREMRKKKKVLLARSAKKKELFSCKARRRKLAEGRRRIDGSSPPGRRWVRGECW